MRARLGAADQVGGFYHREHRAHRERDKEFLYVLCALCGEKNQNERRDMARTYVNTLSGQVIGAAIEVHRQLGPGLLEAAYEECLAHELALTGMPVRA